MKEKRRNRHLEMLVACLVSAVIFAGAAYAQSGEISLVGEINDTHQLVAEDEIFDIDDTPLGDDLVQNYVSMRVKVTGTVRQGEELKVIMVTSFQVIEE